MSNRGKLRFAQCSVKLWPGSVVVTFCAVLSFAQAPAPAKRVIGEVTAIDAGSRQIKLKGDDGNAYTVALTDTTSFLRIPPGETDLKKAAKIAAADVNTGDRALALASGPVDDATKSFSARTVIIMTKSDLAQKRDRERAEWQKRGVVGVITAVDPASRAITITTRGRDSKTITVDAASAQFRRYAPDSVRFADAKASSFDALQPGDTLRALGDKNDDGTRLKAEEVVSGAFQTIAGTVDSVDPASNEVRIINLQSKKPVTVRITSDSLLRRLDPNVAALLARRLRPDAANATISANNSGNNPANPNAASSGAPPSGPPGEGGFRGGPGGGGPGGDGAGFRGPGRFGSGPGGGDLQQILERMPQLSLAELKKGDAVIVSSSKAPGDVPVTAFAFVAGVEPFLAAAPRTSGEVNLGSWNLDLSGGPEQ